MLRACQFHLKARNCKGSGLLSHLRERASILGNARTIFWVHISSYGFQHSHSSCAGFITQLKYSSFLEVIIVFTIYLTHNSRKFMNN